MNEPDPVTSEERRVLRPVFVSYATADRKQALAVCKAIERRGIKCWISSRDVAPGGNYQEEIVRAMRDARAMVLVFSDAANNSDEIKKELSLASRHRVPVMALRIEDVEPSDAFAYELSTRQWIDAFEGWDRSIDSLARRIAELQATEAGASSSPRPAARQRPIVRRGVIGIAAAVLLLLVIAGSWLLLRPTPAAAHSMMVRLTTFQRLSPDVPQGMPDAMRDEIIAAFNEDGVVGVSTAGEPPPGSAPAYALGATTRREGDKIRVITHLTNERSGATLWSRSFDFDADQLSRVPRQIAIQAGNVLHCGLFGASTYSKSLPDPVMSDYLQFCQYYWLDPQSGKLLNSARRVVASAPDFSWGWSAVTIAASAAIFDTPSGPRRQELRNEANQAAAKALALDPTNSEALAAQSSVVEPTDFAGQEGLLKRAIAARPLDCGCEHWQYAMMLQGVGRYADAAAEARRGVDMLALDPDTQFALADSLNVVGKREEAKQHFDSYIDLKADSVLAKDGLAVSEATETGDYAAGMTALANPNLRMPAEQRAALIAAFRAMNSGSAVAKSQAAKALSALPDEQRSPGVIRALAALGASHDALRLFVAGLNSRYEWSSLLWYPSMRGVLNEPAFPGIAGRIGLMRYWRKTHTRPDVCSAKDPPPFCRMI
ncbi:MAG: TIR domain-containing protein [Sphingomicrobium sp.]